MILQEISWSIQERLWQFIQELHEPELLFGTVTYCYACRSVQDGGVCDPFNEAMDNLLRIGFERS